MDLRGLDREWRGFSDGEIKNILQESNTPRQKQSTKTGRAVSSRSRDSKSPPPHHQEGENLAENVTSTAQEAPRGCGEGGESKANAGSKGDSQLEDSCNNASCDTVIE